MALFGRKEPPAPTPAPAPELTGEARKQMHMEQVEAYFKSRNWKYSIEGDYIGTDLHLTDICRTGLISVYPEENMILSMAVYPIPAKPEAYTQVVEFITRANLGLSFGKFLFYYKGGLVSYQASLRSTKGIPSPEDIAFIVDLPARMLITYRNGLKKNLEGIGDPEKDIAEITGLFK